MEDEIDLKEYLAVIQKRWKLIVVLAVVFGLAGLYKGYSVPKMYQATATIMTTDSGGGGLGSALSALSFLGGGGGGGGGDSKLTAIIKSRALATEVARGIKIEVDFPKIAGNTKLTAEDKLQAVVGALNGSIDGKTGKSGLFEITAIWNDPKMAADVANKYIEGLGRFLNARAFNINFQIIDPAIPPDRPFNKNTKQSALMGMGIGLFVGIFIAFGLEYLGKISGKRQQ